MPPPSSPSAQRSIVLSAAAARAAGQQDGMNTDDDHQEDTGEVELQLNEEEEEFHHHHTDAETELDLDADDDDDVLLHTQPHHGAAGKALAVPASSPPPPSLPPPPRSSPAADSAASSPAPAPSHPPPRSSPSHRHSTSTSSKSREVKERELRVILPITAAPITRQNQDDTVIGIAPHHVDFDDDTAVADRVNVAKHDESAAADGREEIWYEDELVADDSDTSAQHSSEVQGVMQEIAETDTGRTARLRLDVAESGEDEEGGGDAYDREVSDIMSKTPSYSQQRQKELAMVAAIKAEKEKNPGHILTSPIHSSSVSFLPASAAVALSPPKAKAKSPVFSYPAPTDGYEMYGIGGASGEKADGGDGGLPSSSTPSSSAGSSGSRPCCPQCLLTSSFACSVFAALTFEFAAIVVLQHVFPSTLLPASLFGLSDSMCNALAPLLSAVLARHLHPNSIASFSSSLQQLCVAGACVLLRLSLYHTDTKLAWLLLMPILAVGVLARLSYNIVKASVAELAVEPGGIGLSRLSMVETVAAIFAPLLFGAVSTYSADGEKVAVLVVGVASLLSLPVCMLVSCRRRPKAVEQTMTTPTKDAGSKAAADKKRARAKKSVKMAVQVAHTPDDPHDPHVSLSTPTTLSPPSAAVISSSASSSSSSSSRLASCLSLIHHPSFLPCVSFALLSTSILCFSVDMIAFLSTQSVSDFALGAGRSLSTLISLFPPLCIEGLVRRVGSDYTGILSLWTQAILLSPIIVIFTLTDRHSIGAFVTPLYICLCFSSVSLSTFRCIESPLTRRPAASSASSGPSEAAVTPLALRVMIHFAIFLSYLLTIVFFNPQWFAVPVDISFACVVLAALVYSLHARRGRGEGRYLHIGPEGAADGVSEMAMMMGKGEGVEAYDDGGVEVELEVADGLDADDEDEHRMDELITQQPHTPV